MSKKTLKGEEREPHQEIYWHFNRANAVRQGDLKVVRAGNAWELYDLKADPTGDKQPSQGKTGENRRTRPKKVGSLERGLQE